MILFCIFHLSEEVKSCLVTGMINFLNILQFCGVYTIILELAGIFLFVIFIISQFYNNLNQLLCRHQHKDKAEEGQ